MIENILLHAEVAVSHNNIYPVNLKLQVHGCLVGLEPVSVALYIANRSNFLELYDGLSAAGIAAMQDRFGLQFSNSF